MKKIYESPRALIDSINSADVITASNTISYNNTQNAEIDSRDVRAFDLFFSKNN